MKIKKILFAVLLIFCSFLMVNAEENDIFKYDVTVESKAEYWNAVIHNIAYYDQGYIVTDVYDSSNYFSTKITKYNKNGEIVKEELLEDIGVTYVEVHGDYIYIVSLVLVDSDAVAYVAKMNMDFEVISEYYDYDHDIGNDVYGYVSTSNMYSAISSYFTFEDDEVVLLTYSGLLFLNDKFEKVNFLPLDESSDEVTRILSELYSYNFDRIEGLSDSGYDIYSCVFTNDVEYYIAEKKGILYMMAYSADKKMFTKTLSDGLYNSKNIFMNVVDDYIVVMSDEKIEIFDLNGSVVQTITLENALAKKNIALDENNYYVFNNLRVGTNGFMYSICEIDYDESKSAPSYNACDRFVLASGVSEVGDVNGTIAYPDVNYYNQSWYLPVNITTKISGKGKVEVIETTRYGELVTFIVTPEEGYKIESIKVTDNEGNVVVFTDNDNTFTMPSSDVTIEAMFVKEVKNPETVTFISAIVFVVLTISGIILYINRRKPVKYEKVK